MDDLKSLVNLVSKQKIKNLDQVIWTNQNTKFTDLYNLIASNEASSDEEASLLLYGTNKSKAYLKLRKRMFERLANTAFFIDKKRSGDSSLESKQIEVSRNYALIRLLRSKGATAASIKISEKTFKKALDIEYTDIAYLLSKLLRKYYAYISYNPKKYERYSILTKNLEDLLLAEAKTDEYYDYISHLATKGKKYIDDQILDEINRSVVRVKELQDLHSSIRVNFNGYQLRSYFHLLKGEFYKCISICDKARSFFKSRPNPNPYFDYIFNNDKFEALVSLGKIEEARIVLSENLDLVSNNPFNWFKIKRMALSLALFEKDYDQAYIICKEVVLNENFKKFKTINEQWKIRIAYIQLLLQAGYVDADLAIENPLPKFNWNDILKTLPLYSKDKRGLNITIIVAQLIFLIINKKSIDILDRIDALNRYCSRYLKNNEDLRSNCFLKMISKLPEADFHPIRVERYVEKYKKRLLGTERILSQEISSTEIIAYEVLWDIILDYIGKNR